MQVTHKGKCFAIFRAHDSHLLAQASYATQESSKRNIRYWYNYGGNFIGTNIVEVYFFSLDQLNVEEEKTSKVEKVE